MHFSRFSLHSLKTRIILINLLVMVGLFLALGFYSKRLIKKELMLFTGGAAAFGPGATHNPGQ